MNDWELFLQEVSWFLQPGENVAVGEAQPWTRGSAEDLPQLSALLASTTLTPIRVEGTAYELLAWGPPDDRRGWLCHPPENEGSGGPVPKTHETFWKLCGGILERFGEPTTWWTNQNEVLTADATQTPVVEILADYAWLWKGDGLKVSINPNEYYAVAIEANGNLTLAHRDNGRVLLFAPDHAFKDVTPLEGSPPYSLLTIDNAPDLATWIEVCAAAWRHR